jgi:hypothetical protein
MSNTCVDTSDLIAAAPTYIDAYGSPMLGRPYLIFNTVPGAKSYVFRIEWNYKNKLLQAGSSYATYELPADEAMDYPAQPPASNYKYHKMWYLPVFDANYAIPVTAQIYTLSFNGALSKSVYDLNLRNVFGDYYGDLGYP